ncbi:MAG: hypothetical protein Q8906_04440 [Bacillota bacterium]|nr:hypothetical protein [Bacillota bacterium]MDP4169836.1 hypothetical protein [Bacillota bacterium]
MSETRDYDNLLQAYRSIWNHRLLTSERESSEVILKEAIKRELLDENSHPRIRKSKYEKYYFAINRLTNSSIEKKEKLELIQLHNDLMEFID